jgi:hypothetical protein
MKTLSLIIAATVLFIGCLEQKDTEANPPVTFSDTASFIVIDSVSSSYEDIKNPGSFLVAYDTLIITVRYDYIGEDVKITREVTKKEK